MSAVMSLTVAMCVVTSLDWTGGGAGGEQQMGCRWDLQSDWTDRSTETGFQDLDIGQLAVLVRTEHAES